MIRKINENEVPEDAGYYGEYGAVFDSFPHVIVYGNSGLFLATVDEFEQVEIDGWPMVCPKESLLLAIGGLPKTESEIFAEENNVSVDCANDVLYLRTRSRWSPELESQLIEDHKAGKSVNICEYGSTAQTKANLYWEASKAARNESP